MVELSAVIEAAIAAGATQVVDRWAGRYLGASTARRAAVEEQARDREAIGGALRRHLVEVSNWSSQLQVWGMAHPVPVANMTAALRMADMPRKFQATDPTARGVPGTLEEVDLLNDRSHYVLLGDPGAGKTTTVKRIIGRLLEAPMPETPDDSWSVPMLVVLREHPNSTSISNTAIERLGLRGLYRRSLVSASAGEAQTEKGTLLSETAFFADFLNDCRAVLFLDGLDEINPDARVQLQQSIYALALRLKDAKIIVSCRSGDFRRTIEGFSTVELLPLRREQIELIAGHWLPGRSKQFMEEISSGAASELCDRPLFLFQMLILSQRTESIPDQPSSLCRQIVRLMLQDWDRQRDIVRSSRYATFDVDAKLSFLTALSYFGTFQLKARRFDHNEFVRAYRTLHRRFGLPAEEANEVANEIETHTGIIVEAGYQSFEFSHLSIQEYLAAEYVVRLPNSDEYRRLLERSPATVAVAVAMSSDPDGFLSALSETLPASDMVYSFISRVLQERPRFSGGDHLGSAVLKVMSVFAVQDHDSMTALLAYPEVADSVRRFIDWREFRRPRGKWSSVRVPLDERLCRRWSVPVDSILVGREIDELLEHR